MLHREVRREGESLALNTRQKAFANNWLKCFNATEAARRAGYSKKTAAQMGYENLRKPEIREYIHARIQEQDLEFVASLDETMAWLTQVMRGEIKDQFGLDAALADRLKACDSLMKRYAALEENRQSERQVSITIEGEEELSE